ncbi:MAG: SDR family NAD(P)-dependent oxidoreductase, partial [Peptococcaceae bacterium]|nr:SDR family NAD(P)-dependent oxidoreductase [Peptococcaceae bacterium]
SPPAEEPKTPWKERGVYLITGGAGGLGLVFAGEIAQRAKDSVIILAGRSSLDGPKRAKLEEFRSRGARVEYLEADVSDKQSASRLIQKIREEHGGLDGIIHGAGVIRDSFILQKTKEQLLEVLAPKVKGLVNLDEASKDVPLDFFILFSSLSGSLGNPGQADYAAANAFMDAYACYRSELAASGKRHGRTISLCWPLWEEGGMRLDAKLVKMLEQNTGLTALGTAAGL